MYSSKLTRSSTRTFFFFFFDENEHYFDEALISFEGSVFNCPLFWHNLRLVFLHVFFLVKRACEAVAISSTIFCILINVGFYSREFQRALLLTAVSKCKKRILLVSIKRVEENVFQKLPQHFQRRRIALLTIKRHIIKLAEWRTWRWLSPATDGRM